MHTYKDAIKNTLGAYVLYPGHVEKIFYEKPGSTIPSVVAFPLTPGINGEDENNIGVFINDFLNSIIDF